MKRVTTYIFAVLSVWLLSAPHYAQTRTSTPVQKKVESVIRNSETLRGALVGVMAMTASGDTLVNVDCDRMLVTASTMKLITTGAALHKLGGDYVYTTRLACSGEITDGRLKGDVIILGGADPTLGSRDSIAVPVQQVFAAWKSMLHKEGVRSISGRIIGDGSWFEGMREHPSWQYEDIGTYYGTGGSGLSYDENIIRYRVQPGATIGSPVLVRQLVPHTPWLSFSNEATTGQPGTGDQLYLYTTDFSNQAILRGTFALGKAPKTILCSNKQAELGCATEFSKYLAAAGICGGTPVGDAKGQQKGQYRILGSTSSTPLRNIARVTNHDSNNFYAETLFRTLGKELTGSACYDSSAVALTRVLAGMGLSAKYGAHIVDGSGLSRKDYISPSFFCKFLAAMMDSPAWDDFYGSLPSPGVNGTVKANLSRLDAEKRGCIRMKSGSMSGVRCYSGYYIPSSGESVIFSVMVNNCTAQDSALRAALDVIITAIVQ